MTLNEILKQNDLIDFQCWYDSTFGHCMRARQYGRDIAWVNGGTPDQLLARYDSSEFIKFVYVRQGRNPDGSSYLNI